MSSQDWYSFSSVRGECVFFLKNCIRLSEGRRWSDNAFWKSECNRRQREGLGGICRCRGQAEGEGEC